MKSKFITSLIAFLFGSTGAHKFYIGQNNKGWYILLFFYVLFPAIIWYSKTYELLNFYMLSSIWIALIIILHFIECIRYAVMKTVKFDNEDKSTGATLPLTITSVVFGIAATYGFNFLMENSGTIDIEKAVVIYEIDAYQLSSEYNADEKKYMDMYHGEVLRVIGVVNSFGEDFEKGIYLALEAAPGSPADVNCFINLNYLDKMESISAGDTVTVSGVCNRRFLDNCKIDGVKKFIIPVSVDTAITL